MTATPDGDKRRAYAGGHRFALPVLGHDRLLGILFVRNAGGLPATLNAHAKAAMTRHLEAAIELAEGRTPASPPIAIDAPGSQPLKIHYFRKNSSVFIDGCYLVKGLAGAILWQLLGDYAGAGRVDFSNRELRLTPALRLPEANHNLEVRLSLLQRRLHDRGDNLRIEKTERGKFRLVVQRPVELLAS